MEFKKTRIMVIGDVMIDNYIYGTVERISPEAPVPVLKKEDELTFLGGAGLVAANLKNLGAEVDFIAVIGKDEEALKIRKFLSDKGIPADGLVVEMGRRTTIKKRFVATTPYFQMLLRLDNEADENIRPETEKEIIERMKNGIDTVDFIIISDYAKGVLTENVIRKILVLAKEKTKKIIVDSKKNLYNYKGAYMVVPNTRELSLAFGLKNTNEDDPMTRSALKLFKALDTMVVVKRGSKGATIADENGTRTYPAMAKKVVNISGAGDIFLSILAMSLASGQNIDEAIKAANLGCGKAIAKRHPTITLEDFQ